MERARLRSGAVVSSMWMDGLHIYNPVLVSFHRRRVEIGSKYFCLLSTREELEMPKLAAGHSWHLSIVRLRSPLLSGSRNLFIEDVKRLGIGTNVHFIPLHPHSHYGSRYGYRKGDFPNAEDAYERAISIPIYADMSDADVEYVAHTIRRVVQDDRLRIISTGSK